MERIPTQTLRQRPLCFVVHEQPLLIGSQLDAVGYCDLVQLVQAPSQQHASGSTTHQPRQQLSVAGRELSQPIGVDAQRVGQQEIHPATCIGIHAGSLAKKVMVTLSYGRPSTLFTISALMEAALLTTCEPGLCLMNTEAEDSGLSSRNGLRSGIAR